MKSLKEFVNPDVKLSPSDQQEKNRIMRGMVKSNRDELVRRYGADVAKVINGRANNVLKTKRTNTLKTIKSKGVDDLISKTLQTPTTTISTPSITTPEPELEPETPTTDIEPETPEVDVEPENDTQDMEDNMEKVDEIISDALKNPKKADLNKDGKLSDYEKKRGAAIEKNVSEDLDLGHEDNEPHMLKADLYRIGKYAMELYKMVDQFEYKGEVDFPSWWQSKVFKAKEALVSAKHYLDFELKEPQIDAMVGVATDTGAIDEANPNMADDDMFRFIMKPQGDGYAVIDDKTGKVVKAGLGLLAAVKLKDKLNNYTRVDVKGKEPWSPDPEVDSDPGQPLGLAEKLAKHLKS